MYLVSDSKTVFDLILVFLCFNFLALLFIPNKKKPVMGNENMINPVMKSIM